MHNGVLIGIISGTNFDVGLQGVYDYHINLYYYKSFIIKNTAPDVPEFLSTNCTEF